MESIFNENDHFIETSNTAAITYLQVQIDILCPFLHELNEILACKTENHEVHSILESVLPHLTSLNQLCINTKCILLHNNKRYIFVKFIDNDLESNFQSIFKLTKCILNSLYRLRSTLPRFKKNFVWSTDGGAGVAIGEKLLRVLTFTFE